MIIEQVVIAYLGGKLSVPVYAEMPADPPSKFIVVDKVGGTRNNFIYEANMSFLSYGPSKYEAAELDQDLQSAMFDIVSLADISACTLGGNTSSTDTTNKKYRYESIFNIIY